MIIDRPVISGLQESEEEKRRRRRRKYIQPQWVVDCVNAGRILSEEQYEQGKTLPAHLSPFGEEKGAYDPSKHAEVEANDVEDVMDEEEDVAVADVTPLDAAVARAAEDSEQLHAAELEAESRGVDFGTFEKKLAKAKTSKGKNSAPQAKKGDDESDMNKMMMSRKQRTMYEKMKYGERKHAAEVRLYFVNPRDDAYQLLRGNIWKTNGSESRKIEYKPRTLEICLVFTSIFLCFVILASSIPLGILVISLTLTPSRNYHFVVTPNERVTASFACLFSTTTMSSVLCN